MQGRCYCHYEEIWRPAEEFNYIVKLSLHNDWSRLSTRDHFKEISYNEAEDIVEHIAEDILKPTPRAVCVFCQSMGRTLQEKYGVRKHSKSQLVLIDFITRIVYKEKYVSNYQNIIG